MGLSNGTCLSRPRPLLQVGKLVTDACIARRKDYDLEVFSHNPTHGSFVLLAFLPSTMTNCAINGSSRSRLNYYCNIVISKVKLTYLTMVQTQLMFHIGG